MKAVMQLASLRAARIPIVVHLVLMMTSSWGASASDTGRLSVSASVVNQCAVGSAALALGALTLVSANGTMSTLSGGAAIGIPWGCTNGTTATLSFGLGSNTNGSERRLVSPAAGASGQYIEYQLRADSSSGPIIGTTAVALNGADGTNKTFTVWGGPVNSAVNRAAKPGNDYADAVLLTVTFAP